MTKIISLELGALACNAYLLWQPERDDAVVIDPGADAQRLLHSLEGRRVAAVLLTHGHFDHISALDALRSDAGTRVGIHVLDAPMLNDPWKNLSVLLGAGFAMRPADLILSDGTMIEAAGMRFTVLHTPGHTPGSVCYRLDDHLFTGDTLLYNAHGRVDLPGGDAAALRRSLARLFALEGITCVHPGHGQATDLSVERGRRP